MLALDIKQMQKNRSTIFFKYSTFFAQPGLDGGYDLRSRGEMSKSLRWPAPPPIFCLPDQGKSQWKVFWGSNEKECMEKYFHWTPAFHKWSLLIIVTINHCVKVLINEHNLSCYQYSLMCFILYEIWQIERREKWGYMWHFLRIFYLKYFID